MITYTTKKHNAVKGHYQHHLKTQKAFSFRY